MRLYSSFVVAVIALALGASATGTADRAGVWRMLPAAPAPAATADAVAVWTGHSMIVVGRRTTRAPWSRDVAAAYDPAHRKWTRLSPLPGPKGNYEGSYHAVWTGREVLVLGPFDFQAFEPRRATWRRLPLPPAGSMGPSGVVAWTGRELITWGGGCCGDASNGGAMYVQSTNSWHTLPRSPLAPAQSPVGGWTGHRLIVVVSGRDPSGRLYPAREARAAAFDPATSSWRRIAPMPGSRSGAVGVWTGRELLVIGGATPTGGPTAARTGFAYDPERNTWRVLPPMPAMRTWFAAVWGAGRLFLWGGAGNPVGLEYPPAAGRWFTLPAAPLRGRDTPAAVWTGHALIVWGGRGATDGASFTLSTGP